MGSNISSSALPEWALQFAFWAAVVLSVIQFVKFARDLLDEASLDVKLTSEIFMRVTETGETFFANAIYLARHGGVIVEKVTFELFKTSGSTKAYSLPVKQLGEKVAEPGQRLANFHFYSTSPTDLIQKDSPRRCVYMVEQSEYRERLDAAMREFEGQCKAARESVLAGAGESELSDEEKKRFWVAYNNRIATTAAEIAGMIQLEPGSYNMAIVVKYKPLNRVSFARRSRTASSSITFEVGSDFMPRMRSQIEQLLRDKAENVILEGKKPYFYPEYNPPSVIERTKYV